MLIPTVGGVLNTNIKYVVPYTIGVLTINKKYIGLCSSGFLNSSNVPYMVRYELIVAKRLKERHLIKIVMAPIFTCAKRVKNIAYI